MSLGKTLLAQTLALDFKDGCKRYDTMGDGIIKLPRYILDGHMLDEHIFLKNGPSVASFHLFSSFQTNITILQQIYVIKCPSGIQCWDLNSQPPVNESPPIPAKPGLLSWRDIF